MSRKAFQGDKIHYSKCVPKGALILHTAKLSLLGACKIIALGNDKFVIDNHIGNFLKAKIMCRAHIMFSRCRDMTLNLGLICTDSSPGVFMWSTQA